MNNQNQLARFAAPKKQSTPFHALPAEQQLIIERTRNHLESTQAELNMMAMLASSQSSLSTQVAEFLRQLPDEVQTAEYERSREILLSMFSALGVMAAQLERMESSLLTIQLELPDLTGERAAELRQRQQGGVQ